MLFQGTMGFNEKALTTACSGSRTAPAEAECSLQGMKRMDKPFQRKGSESNAHVGRDFKEKIQRYFEKQGLSLSYGVTVPIGKVLPGRNLIPLIWGIKTKKS
jgi:hypothetical protein